MNFGAGEEGHRRGGWGDMGFLMRWCDGLSSPASAVVANFPSALYFLLISQVFIQLSGLHFRDQPFSTTGEAVPCSSVISATSTDASAPGIVHNKD